VATFHARAQKVLSGLGSDWEIPFVLDPCPDRTERAWCSQIDHQILTVRAIGSGKFRCALGLNERDSFSINHWGRWI
jgi:hypothetical protein